MANIQVLDQATINKIAAGEVIERPASVVKELLENAIDAGATAVTVEVKEGGISFIRITDNGCGIAPEDVPVAFLRHSTSKIRSVEDLLTVSSLGFRGEALSSIAAVAQVELLTKSKEAFCGTRYRIEGGKEISREEVGVPDGTTFLVRNLFFNTPARKKFLKSAMTEASYVSDIVEKIALSHPEVSIRYIQNGQSRVHTSGNTNLKDIIYNIYGKEITQNLLAVDAANDTVRLTGFVGKPIISRGNRSLEHYYINGRYIKSSLIAKAIEEAYKPFMMQHKYPFCVLIIETDSELLDVNVHPTKMELRFRNQEDLYQIIMSGVTAAIKKSVLIPEVTLEEKKGTDIGSFVFGGNRTEKGQEEKAGANFLDAVIPEAAPKNDDESAPAQDTANFQRTKEIRGAEPFESRRKEETAPVYRERVKEEQISLFDPDIRANFSDASLSQAGKTSTDWKIGKEPPYFRIIGQAFGTYWIIEQEDRLYLIDQHAAHEKVLYERTMKSLETKQFTSQQIYPPAILHLNQHDALTLQRYLNYFVKLGFEVEEFGGTDYAIRSVPANLFSINPTALFTDCLDSLGDADLPTKPEMILERVASMSCKAAVKGNTTLSYEEAKALIGELLLLDNPFHCPHGRPTIIEMTKYELEKRFKRIV